MVIMSYTNKRKFQILQLMPYVFPPSKYKIGIYYVLLLAINYSFVNLYNSTKIKPFPTNSRKSSNDTNHFERERKRECVCMGEIFNFLKVHLGDSNRQPQSSCENLEWYP